MKYIVVVTLVFLMHVSMATINAALVASGNTFTDIVNPIGTFKLQPSQSWLFNVENEAKGNQYFQSSATQQASSNFGFGDFVKALAIFITTFAFGIIAVPYTLTLLGLPLTLALPLSLPIYLLYGLGLAQFVGNRANKSME